MVGIDETRVGLGCAGMPPLPKPHANFGRDSSSRRDSENSGVSWAAVARTASGGGRLRTPRPNGMVLNTDEKPVPDSCVLDPMIPALNPLVCRPFDLESPAPCDS